MNFPRIFLRRVIKRNNLLVGKRRRKIVKSESGFKKLRTKLRNVCTRKNWSSVDNPADTSVIGNLISRFVSSRGKPHDGTHMRYPLKGDSKTIHPLIDDYLRLFLRYFFFFFSFPFRRNATWNGGNLSYPRNKTQSWTLWKMSDEINIIVL